MWGGGGSKGPARPQASKILTSPAHKCCACLGCYPVALEGTDKLLSRRSWGARATTWAAWTDWTVALKGRYALLMLRAEPREAMETEDWVEPTEQMELCLDSRRSTKHWLRRLGEYLSIIAAYPFPKRSNLRQG